MRLSFSQPNIPGDVARDALHAAAEGLGYPGLAGPAVAQRLLQHRERQDWDADDEAIITGPVWLAMCATRETGAAVATPGGATGAAAAAAPVAKRAKGATGAAAAAEPAKRANRDIRRMFQPLGCNIPHSRQHTWLPAIYASYCEH